MADRRRTRRRTEADTLAEVALAGAMRAAELADREDREASRPRTSEGRTRVEVLLEPDLARALRLAAADRGVPPWRIVSEALRLLLSRRPPPGYQPPPGPDLSPPAALERARELRRQGETFPTIAEALNLEGFRTLTGREWTAANVKGRLRRKRSRRHIVAG